MNSFTPIHFGSSCSSFATQIPTISPAFASSFPSSHFSLAQNAIASTFFDQPAVSSIVFHEEYAISRILNHIEDVSLLNWGDLFSFSIDPASSLSYTFAGAIVAANIVCMRGGPHLERFDATPGPSEDESSTAAATSAADFWRIKDSDSIPALAMVVGGGSGEQQNGIATARSSPDVPTPTKRPAASSCTSCQQEITDRFILRVQPNMEFHASCLKCWQCHRSLDETCTAFVRNGQTYCQEDYLRNFGAKCSRCSRLFERREMVMRARHLIFHLDCFNCSACERRLNTGDEFLVKGDQLYCRADCDTMNAAEVRQCTRVRGRREHTAAGSGWPHALHRPLIPAAGLRRVLSYRASMFWGDDNVDDIHYPYWLSQLAQKPAPAAITPSMYQPNATEEEWETSTMTSLDPPISNSPLSPKSDEVTTTPTFNVSLHGKKSKKDKQSRQATRVRTVLNETQLAILKKCYNMNSRPDAMIKEHLVEVTGLNARVIRVWFQNKRCKDKKRQIQQRDYEANAAKERALNGVRMSGVGPLLAASPQAHMEPSLGQPIDIQHYAQWGPPMQDDRFHPPPMSYTELGPGGDLAHFGLPPTGPPSTYHEFSPHLLSSDLSSPSCSE